MMPIRSFIERNSLGSQISLTSFTTALAAWMSSIVPTIGNMICSGPKAEALMLPAPAREHVNGSRHKRKARLPRKGFSSWA